MSNFGVTTQGGARLAFVVVPLDGTVKREVVQFKETKAGRHKDGSPRITHEMVRKLADKKAGYMVYFPRGHALRLTEAQLKQYRLHNDPAIINMQGLHHPQSPMGKLLAAQDDKTRKGAFMALEKQVIQLATRLSGPVLMPEQLQGKVEAVAE